MCPNKYCGKLPQLILQYSKADNLLIRPQKSFFRKGRNTRCLQLLWEEGITLHSNSPSGWPHLEQKLSELFHWRRDQPRVRQLAIPSSTVKRPNRRSVNRPPYSASISRGSTWPPIHAFSHQITQAPVRIVGTAGLAESFG